MVRRPAHPELQPPLALPVSPVNIPHPLRPPNSHNRHAPTRDQHRGGALDRPHTSDVRHADRPTALRHLLRRERAGHLPAKVLDVLELRRERIHALSVDALDCRRVQAGGGRERNTDVRVRAEGHRRLACARAGSVRRDRRTEERPLVHGFCERLEEDGEVREASVVGGRGHLGGCGWGVEGCGGDDLCCVWQVRGWWEIVLGDVRVQGREKVVQFCDVETRRTAVGLG